MGNSSEGFGFETLLEIASRCGSATAFKKGISWNADSDLERSWADWTRSSFQPFILPHLLEVQDLSSRQFVREILGLDRAFSSLLSKESEEKSLEAGRQLLSMKSLRADRTLDRIQRAVAAGNAPGHFATLFAVRAAVFSIAPRTTVSAYLLQELVCEIPDPDLQAELLALGLSEVNDFFRHSAETKAEAMRSNA
jgi:UreF-like urease accessory protein